MTESVPVTYIVTVTTKRLEGGFFTPNVAVVKQQGRTYKTGTMGIEEELFYTQAAAVDHAIMSVKATLRKSSPQAEIRFNLPSSDVEGVPPSTAIYRYSTHLYGSHPRLGDKVLSFARQPNGELAPGNLCSLPARARQVGTPEISAQDEMTILEVLKALAKE